MDFTFTFTLHFLLFLTFYTNYNFLDTLACYPFTDKDPFIIPEKSTPSVFFAGNQVCNCVNLMFCDVM